MQQFWWVNHKQTFKQEIEGEFIWAPKTKANGNESTFYNNMQKVKPGDWIISFANAKISLVGVIQGYASSLPKPKDFLSVGDNWVDIGWYVPVKWTKVNTPLKVKDLIDQIAGLLPKKYSPIQNNGNGNQGAYLCKIDAALFEKIAELTNFSTENLSTVFSDGFTEKAKIKFEDEIETQIENGNISDTEKQSLVNARRGQGKFKEKLCKIETSCRLTLLKNKTFLIASHIKPWSLCETAFERLDGNNGLLLAPHVDKLFDNGFISFEQSGRVLVSPHLDEHTISALGLKKELQTSAGSFSNLQEAYMAFHRSKIFLRAE